MAKTHRLYLDQMFGTDVAEALRHEGHDVLRASETGHARADDRHILEKAMSENRVLITLDAHFGDWAVLPLKKHPGVIRIKANPATSKNVLNLLVPFLREYETDQFKDHLLILSSKRSKWVQTV